MDRRSFFGWAAGGIAALLGLRVKPKTQWIGIHKVMEQEWSMRVVKVPKKVLTTFYPELLPLMPTSPDLGDHVRHIQEHINLLSMNGLFKKAYADEGTPDFDTL